MILLRRSLSPVFLLLAPILGCAEPEADVSPAETEAVAVVAPEVEAPAFPSSAGSLDELGGFALNALVLQRREALDSVRLTESEHNEVVFPELPAGSPEVNYPLDLAWQNIELRNGRAVSRQLAWFSGRTAGFMETRCRGDSRGFRTFVVHTDCWVIFRDDEEGVLEIQLFKDVLERGDGFKIFRYYDDPPRRRVAG